MRLDANKRVTMPQRLRITFSKGENLRYISHLDLARTWERSLRRAGVPLLYSQGFNPRPKMVFASALSVGCTGGQEVMDILLNDPVPPKRLFHGLIPRLPPGLGVIDITPVHLQAPALPTQLRGAEYEGLVTVDESLKAARARCQALLDRSAILRERRGKAYDLRPLIKQLAVVGAGNGHILLWMHLSAGEAGTGRPDEVLAALGWEHAPHRCHRRQLHFVFDKS
jgi:radical SAM-linked protein